MRALYRYDKQLKKMVEVWNDREITTTIMSDEMQAFKHPRTGEIISSKAKWNTANRATGLIEHKGTIERKSRHDVDSDNDQAIQKAIVAAENGNLKITEVQRAWAKQNDARIRQQFGVDVSDVMKSRY